MIWRSPWGRLLLLSLAASLSLWTLFRLVVQPPPDGTTASGKLNHLFPWRPSSTSLNDAAVDAQKHDAAPMQPSNKLIVVGKQAHEDTSWIERELPDWQRAIYSTDDSTAALHTPVNRSSAALLSYIVANYDSPSFPGFIASIPAARYSPWQHEDAIDRDAAYMLNHLQLFWCEGTGFCNFRCVPSPGCAWDAEESQIGVDQQRVGREVYEGVWRGLFGDEKEVPRDVAINGGGRFGVSKFQVTRRSKNEYERMLAFVERAEYPDEEFERVMNDYWHVIFGQEPVHCMGRRTCYNLVYGRLGVV